VKAAATKCRFCGESLIERVERGHREIDAGDILTSSWEIYKKRFGIVFGSSLVIIGISMTMNLVFQVIQAALQVPMAVGGRRGAGFEVAQIVLLGVFWIASIGVQAYLQAGYQLLLLKVARGEPGEFAEIFSAGRFFWRIVGAGLLFWLLFIAGLICLIVPGFFVLLALWPYTLVIIDRDCGVIESLRFSHEATQGNYLACILLALAALGVSVLGMLACCIGVIFANPFTALFFTVAYCGMTGQLVATGRKT
jgi:hypothetical protein